jgi:hypothetical protein
MREGRVRLRPNRGFCDANLPGSIGRPISIAGNVTREATRETRLRRSFALPFAGTTASILLILLRLLTRRFPIVLEGLGPVGVIQIGALVHNQWGGGGPSA